MKLTIGKKIGLAFTSLLLILTLAGGYGILKMRLAATGAKSLSDEYVAEWVAADKLLESLNDMMLNSRTYSLTGGKTYLDNVHKALIEMKPIIGELQVLSQRASHLARLKDQLTEVQQTATAYEQYSNTEEIIRRVGDDPAGIGFAAIGITDPKVKLIALTDKKDGEYSTGSPEDIVAGKYVFGRHLYFYVRREPGQPVDPVVKEYFRLILSREGQQIIAAEPNGYMPLTAAEAAAELAKLD